MIIEYFAVYDSKSKLYSKPFPAQTPATAIRSFENQINDPQPGNILNMYPGDHNLFHIGEYNEEEGTFQNKKVPINLGNALEFKKDIPGVEKENPGKIN